VEVPQRVDRARRLRLICEQAAFLNGRGELAAECAGGPGGAGSWALTAASADWLRPLSSLILGDCLEGPGLGLAD